MTRSWHRVAALVASASVVAGGLAACSGASGDGDAQPADEPTPAEVVAAARKHLDETTGVRVTLATDDLPKDVTGVTSAEGTGVHPSAFEGTFSVRVSGLTVDLDVVAVDGTTYAKGGLLLPTWTDVSPGNYGAPDPNSFMDPDGGFSGLLGSAEDLEKGDSVRGGTDNKEILTEFTGTLPEDAVTALVPSATGDFAVTYTITDDDELRQAVLEGDFYGADEGSVTYTLDLEDYGTEKEITAP